MQGRGARPGVCWCPWMQKNKIIINLGFLLIDRCSLFLFLYLAGDWFVVNAEIDLVVLGLFPGSQSIKLVLFNQGS